MNAKQLQELLLQSLEHERGGIQVYETALECAVHDRLREEWKEYLQQTRRHERILHSVLDVMGVDPETETRGRSIVRKLGLSLVEAMRDALGQGKPEAAQIVACECVVLAETRDHLDWQLIGKCAENVDGRAAEALRKAYDEVENEEDEHLYHTKGWCRELWVQSLGLTSILPPPEERQHVRTAIGAARAEQAGELERISAEPG